MDLPSRGDKQEFVPGIELAKVASKGKFEVISSEMSDTLKAMLWPVEMGQAVNDSALVQAKKTLKPDDAKLLDAAFAKYLDNQLEDVRRLVGKSIPDRLAGFEKATKFSTRFKSTEPGKAARQIVIDLNKDKAFKSELLAKTAYAKLMQTVARTPERGEALRNGFQRSYQGTYYAQVASQASDK